MIGRDFWDISPIFTGKPPLPKQLIKCPVCNSSTVFFKYAHTFKRYKDQYRTDITIKCGNCAYVMVFGVHITEEEFNKMEFKRLDYVNTGHVNLNGVIQ